MNLRHYIGIPFEDHGRRHDGCDCYGLVQLVYREQLGITLPDLGDRYSDAYARGEVNEVVTDELAKDWNFDVTTGPWKPLDIMIFSRAGGDHHVGLYIRPGEMLHIVDGAMSAFERYDTAKWKFRLSRVIRHVERT